MNNSLNQNNFQIQHVLEWIKPKNRIALDTTKTLQNIAFSLIILISIGWLLFISSNLVVPLVFAIVLAVFLNPVDKRIRRVVKIKWMSIVLSFMCLILPMVLVSTLFSLQLLSILESMPSIGENLKLGMDQAIEKIKEVFPFIQLNSNQFFAPKDPKNLEGPIKIVGQSLISTTSLLTSAGLTLIFAYLFLYYKVSFKNFIIYQFERENRPDVKQTLEKIKEIIQSYIGGLGIVVVILSILNSIGLWLIGVPYAIFWGVLGGILAIIPYFGTIMGGMLPFLYSLATADTNLQPVLVILFYLFVQQIEGNFITPKIIGSKVDINPLFALLSLLFLGSFWGVGGIILALPLISIVKIILSQFPETLPYAVLMSSDISNKKGIFKKLAT